MKAISKLFVLILLVCSFQNIHAQLNVSNSGSVSINANINDWHSGLNVTVPTRYSCAYHLRNNYYGGSDVFYVRGDGYVWTRNGFLTSSDKKFKTDITNITSSIAIIKKLDGVKYKRKYNISTGNIVEKVNDRFEYGLIAQDVEEIIPEVVHDMHDGSKAVSYTELIPFLIEAIKEQQLEIEKLKNKIKKDSGNLKSAQTSIGESKIADGYLSQNTPNPFPNQTEIGYFIEESSSASIMIFDLQGTLIKTIPIQNYGQGTITISNSDFKAGMYLYTLVSNGVEIDTKRMIVNN